jgi:hypothetical protein
MTPTLCRNLCTTLCAFFFGASVLITLPAQAAAQDPSFTYNPIQGDSLSDWVITGCDVELNDGILRLADGNGFVRLAHPLRDFEFKFSFKPEKESGWDSGIYFRSELPQGDSPWPKRHQINLLENQEGRLIGVQGGDVPQGLIKRGEWNELKLRAIGGTITLHINGQPAWSVVGLKPLTGYLGIQSEVPLGGSFQFKDMEVTEFQTQSLFDGQSLEGWTPVGNAENRSWEVRDQLLVCTGEKGSWLRLNQPLADFNLRLQYLLKPHGNSGVYIRVPEDGNHHGEGSGIEVQILDDRDPGYKDLKAYQYACSLYAIVPAQPRVGRDAGQWNTLEIDAQDQRYRIWHNGQLVIDADAEKYPELAQRRIEGYIGLQNHSEEVLFRRLRVSPSYQAESDSEQK